MILRVRVKDQAHYYDLHDDYFMYLKGTYIRVFEHERCDWSQWETFCEEQDDQMKHYEWDILTDEEAFLELL